MALRATKNVRVQLNESEFLQADKQVAYSKTLHDGAIIAVQVWSRELK